jgi:hypothetical protein
MLYSNRLDADYMNTDIQYAPLVGVWNNESAAALNASGNIIQMIPDPTAQQDFFALDYNGHVYGVTHTAGVFPSAIVDFGTVPNIGSGQGPAQTIAYYNNKLVAAGPISGGYGFSYVSPTGGSWTSVTTNGAGGRNSSAVFQNNLYVGGTGDNRIYQINPSWGISANPGVGLNLPSWLGTIDIENYNNKYLAIAAGPINFQDYSFINNYIYLWDGVSLSWNYVIEAPGRIISMKTINGTLFVAVADSATSSTIYYLSGLTLKKLFNTAQSFAVANQVDSNGNKITTKPLFNFMGHLGIISSIQNGNGRVFVYRLDTKELFSVLSYVNNCIVTSRINVNPPQPKIFYSYLGGAYLVLTNSFGGCYFTTNTIDLNGQITSVEVYYDSPPPAGNSSIVVTINYENENSSGLGLNSTTQLASITASNYTNSKYTILDGQGIVCKKMRMTVNCAVYNNWKPIIRKVVINYEPSVII